MSEFIARLPLAGLSPSTGFRSDARFAAAPEVAVEDHPPAPPVPDAEPAEQPLDPLDVAWAEGWSAAMAEAEARAAAREAQDAAAREGLALSFARLDRELEEELRLRLRDTVAALCESALAPLALDHDALLARIERAVAMLARADDERVIRLNPEDMRLIAPRLAAEWTVRADPALERGSVRVESPNGGVEDGPAQWRRAIAEALHQC
jgi:flagellar assembly protein FliH